MTGQPGFPGLRHAMKKTQARREKVLAGTDAVAPWTRLLALIGPRCPKAGPKGGRPPMSLETDGMRPGLPSDANLGDPGEAKAELDRGH